MHGLTLTARFLTFCLSANYSQKPFLSFMGKVGTLACARMQIKLSTLNIVYAF